jgi:hypothetical protein
LVALPIVRTTSEALRGANFDAAIAAHPEQSPPPRAKSDEPVLLGALLAWLGLWLVLRSVHLALALRRHTPTHPQSPLRATPAALSGGR